MIEISVGRRVPRVGLGTWYLGDRSESREREIAALRAGLDAGMQLIDTAEMYGGGRSELLVGEAIRGRRDEVYLVSKVLPSNASARGTIAAAEASLRRLGTDHLDLYLLHWRGNYPFAETISAFEQLIADGKIRAWGVSNMDPADMEEILETAGGAACATNQVLYNLTRRGPEYDLFPLLRDAGISVMAYSPLEQARLFSGQAGRTLARLAAEMGTSAPALATAWTVRDGRTVAIPRSGRPEHVREFAAALELSLGDDVLRALDAAFPPPTRPVPLEML